MPGLEGVRALAIVMVILIHYTTAATGGFVGVDLFFVLSGFLITTLLLEEHAEHGRISLRGFYRRRVVRLGPALLALIVVDLVIRGVQGGQPALVAAIPIVAKPLSFVGNWLSMDGSPTNEFDPTWSLAVEEQFYIVWSAALVLLVGRGWSAARIGRRAALAGVLVSVWCLAVYLITDDWMRAIFGSDTRSAGLFFGAALACARFSGATARVPAAVARWGGRVGLAALLVFCFVGTPIDYLHLWGLALTAMAVLLVASIVDGRDPVLRWASTRRPVLWTGKVSYGLYLWNTMAQIFVIMLLGTDRWVVALVGIPLTVAMASLSFRFVERPVSRWARARVAARAGASDAAELAASSDAAAEAHPDGHPVVIDLRTAQVEPEADGVADAARLSTTA